MEKITAWIKSHPYESGALALVGAIGLYLVFKSSSGGTAASSSTNSAASDYYNAQLQAAQITASQTAQQNALQAQEYTSQLNASVSNTTTAAQLAAIQDQDSSAVQSAQIAANSNNVTSTLAADVANSQVAAQVTEAQITGDVTNNATNAQLAAISDQIQGQVDSQQIAANVSNATTAAQVQENNDNLASVLGIVTAQDQVQQSEYYDQYLGQQANDNTAVAINTNQMTTLNNEANDATVINLQGLQDQTIVDTTQANNQYALQSTALNAATQGGPGGVFYGQSATTDEALNSLFGTAFGESNVGVAGEQANASISSAAYADSAATNAAIASAASKTAGNIISALFS
jgi:hypothetical protein